MNVLSPWSYFGENTVLVCNCCVMLVIIKLDDDMEAKLMNWVPRKLAPQIRCVFSLINDTAQHKSLMARESKPKDIYVRPLDLAVRKV